MCGISGKLAFSTIQESDRALISSMMRDLNHRGPDQEGRIEIDSSLIFGSNRLTIVDQDGSKQPMQCACGLHFLVFNGEVFNSEHLRMTLDYSFSTKGDTETLLALLCIKGIDFLNEVRGQFAFALYSSTTGELVLGVDQFGIVPLYVLPGADGVLFSSSSRSIAKNLNLGVVNSFLKDSLGKKGFLPGKSAYESIERIPPGNVWTFSKMGFSKRIWHNPSFNMSLAVAENIDVVSLLENAVERATTADCEVGVFLSGGVDSAIVAYFAQKNLPYRLKAYTAVFPGAGSHDDENLAKVTADELDLDHKLVSIEAQDWWNALNLGSRSSDSPLWEPADAAYFLLSKAASLDLKVVLTGEGADELFGGYSKYKLESILIFNWVKKIFTLAHPMIDSLLSPRLGRLFFAIQSKSALSRFERYFGPYWPSEIKIDDLETEKVFSNLDVDTLRDWDLQRYLPVLLDRADQMSMANHLETRPIFLDRDLASYAFSLSPKEMYSFFDTKKPIKKVARQILHKGIINSRKKGFPIPISAWFGGDLYMEVKTLFLSEGKKLQNFISEADLMNILESHKNKKKDYSGQIYHLVAVLIWHSSQERLKTPTR
jgi:asparagine synthase (glutamine-hydrolysing)